MGSDQRRGDQLCPAVLPLFVADQVVADFQEQMRDAAALAVHRDRIVGKVVDQIRLVVSRVYHWVLRPEVSRNRAAKRPSRLERAPRCQGRSRPAGEPRREAVDGHEDRMPRLLGAPVQKRRKRAVERLVDLFEAQTPLLVGQSPCCPGRACRRSAPRSSPEPRMAGCSRPPGDCSAEGRAARRAARNSRRDNSLGTDVRRDVACHVGRADPEPAQPLRDRPAGMFAGQQEDRPPTRIHRFDGRRVAQWKASSSRLREGEASMA